MLYVIVVTLGTFFLTLVLKLSGSVAVVLSFDVPGHNVLGAEIRCRWKGLRKDRSCHFEECVVVVLVLAM